MAGATDSPKCKLCGVAHRIGAPHDRAGLKSGAPSRVLIATEQAKLAKASSLSVGRAKAAQPKPKKRPPGAATASVASTGGPKPAPAGAAAKAQATTP